MKHFSAPSGRLRTGDRRHILWEIHRAQGALRARSSFAGWLSENPPRSRVVAGVRCQGELELRNNLAENAMRSIALRPAQRDTHRKRGSRVARCSDRLGNRNLPKLKIYRNLAVTSTVGCSDGYKSATHCRKTADGMPLKIRPKKHLSQLKTRLQILSKILNRAVGDPLGQQLTNISSLNHLLKRHAALDGI